MEGPSNSGQSPNISQPVHWSPAVRHYTVADTTPLPTASILQSPQIPTQIALSPHLFPQQSAAYQAQLAEYNKLISTGRTNRVHPSPLPPQLSASTVPTAPRPKSKVQDSNKTQRSGIKGGHGNTQPSNSGIGERLLMTKENPGAKMSGKKFDKPVNGNPRPLPQQHNSSISHQSSSVPSTPHQHPRKFSLSSRDPSPNAGTSHSPRSAYSESDSTLPPLRSLPPRFGRCKFETAMAYSRRRMPYSIGTDRLEKVKPGNIKPKMTAEVERKLSGDMRELYDRLLPTPESEAKRTKFVDKLEGLLNEEWPGHDIKVHMFGSSGNLLCTDDSDVDICITTEWKELENVCMLAELLAKRGMEKVICVSTAKVPIVKIWDPELRLACDMNVNNTLALENTRMIKTYIQIDDRVRPLAMLIKYWTRRRVVNDAAFGGTLSSYTWICMIINFLQTRKPPLLPALHQRPHQKLPAQDGHETAFADDVEALSGFGQPNKETLGELLFQFFRFYGHDMDYDKHVVSVRSGKLIPKHEKGWHLAANNMLCVEEPFNTIRNLGNTADDTSFRGLHIELRRAFDLVAEGKFDECCEQYEFPKEEERVWEKATATVVKVRSASQTGRGGRGGPRAGRGNTNTRTGSSSSRRFSNPGHGPFQHMSQTPQGFMNPEAWIQTQQAQVQLHTELYSQLSQLKAQENSLRNQLYIQSQQFAQMQTSAYGQVRRQQHGSNNIVSQQATDRNRGSSFDNPPLTAPIRPDMYFYPMVQSTSMYGQHSPSTYPSSPAMSPALPEMRRSLHRTTVTNGAGLNSNPSGSSLRSHSQPAARSVPNSGPYPGLAIANYGVNGLAPYAHLQPNGVTIPNFIADENVENALESQSTSVVDSPSENSTPKEYVGYYLDHPTPQPRSREPMVLPAIPAFGDISQRRRRPSTDQFPHAIYDRLRRDSRSPSPLGRSGTHSVDISTPAIAGHGGSGASLRAPGEHSPVVVNGSQSVPKATSPSRHELTDSTAQATKQPFSSFDYAGKSAQDQNMPRDERNPAIQQIHQSQDMRLPISHEAPMVVNGSHPVVETHQPVYGLGISNGMNGTGSSQRSSPPSEPSDALTRVASNGRQRTTRQQPSGGVQPLDIGPSQAELLRDDVTHLSPVYETRSPSPTASRKVDLNLETGRRNVPAGMQSTKSGDSNNALKFALSNSSLKAPINQSQASPAPKSNGHTRAAKSDGGSSSSILKWQQPKNRKKGQVQGQPAEPKGGPVQGLSEKMPVKDSDRKGG